MDEKQEEPRRFGPFILQRLLARGGMGEVHLASAIGVPGAPPLCVVKTMRADVTDDPQALKRFIDESRISLLLIHPSIVRVVDAGRVADVRYLALELVYGVDLRRLLERGGKIDTGVALWIGGCLFDALGFAHGARHPLNGQALHVVHRDISPHNVMVGADGNVRVIDFGLALSSLKQSRTEQNIVLGKLAYMSPEQARGEAVDARCDIYAAGVVLYELLSGQRYWGDKSAREVWDVIGAGTHVPPGWATLHPKLQALLTPLLAGDPNKRESIASRVTDRMAGLLHEHGGFARARKVLGALVERLAVEELAKLRSVKPDEGRSMTESAGFLAAAEPPTSVVAFTESHPVAQVSPPLTPPTESVALIDARAVEAAIAAAHAAPPTLTLLLEAVSPPTLQLPESPLTLQLSASAPPAHAPKSRTALAIAAGAGIALAAVVAVGWFFVFGAPGAPAIGAAPGVDAGVTAVAALHSRDAGPARAAHAPVDAGVAARSDAGSVLAVPAVASSADAGAAALAAVVDAGSVIDEAAYQRARIAGCNEVCAKQLWKTLSSPEAAHFNKAQLRAVRVLVDPCAKKCRGR